MKAHNFYVIAAMFISSCNSNSSKPSLESIDALALKRGAIISCGSSEILLGKLNFNITGSDEAKKEFIKGLKLLHSFEYDEAEKVFANAITSDPTCAMAYWGVAMSNFHPLWAPPSEQELIKGEKAIDIALNISAKTKKENDYILAISKFYSDRNKADHNTRCKRFEKGMEVLSLKYPDDHEASIFYALSITAAADPQDKTFARQKKAGAILNALYPGEPDHPGIVHYIIHTYDYPGLAEYALPAARKYASVAPSSAHALHMPSHIFTRLGLWDECIKSNIASVYSAQCYAKQAKMKGHWDEELHGLDYLVYAYLQKGLSDSAIKLMNYLESIKEVHPNNFKVAYAFASIPSRIVLENKMWNHAAALKFREGYNWEDFPWQKSIIHFTRLLGNIHINNIAAAKDELIQLKNMKDRLIAVKDEYKAGQVNIQIKAGEAWISLAEGDENKAIEKMEESAQLEDKTEKHPVTPGEIIPARELLGDMYMQMKRFDKALAAYEKTLIKHPGRLNSIKGATASSARTAGHKKKTIMLQAGLK